MGASLSHSCLKLVGIRLRELRREDWRTVAVRLSRRRRLRIPEDGAHAPECLGPRRRRVPTY